MHSNDYLSNKIAEKYRVQQLDILHIALKSRWVLSMFNAATTSKWTRTISSKVDSSYKAQHCPVYFRRVSTFYLKELYTSYLILYMAINILYSRDWQLVDPNWQVNHQWVASGSRPKCQFELFCIFKTAAELRSHWLLALRCLPTLLPYYCVASVSACIPGYLLLAWERSGRKFTLRCEQWTSFLSADTLLHSGHATQESVKKEPSEAPRKNNPVVVRDYMSF